MPTAPLHTAPLHTAPLSAAPLSAAPPPAGALLLQLAHRACTSQELDAARN